MVHVSRGLILDVKRIKLLHSGENEFLLDYWSHRNVLARKRSRKSKIAVTNLIGRGMLGISEKMEGGWRRWNRRA